MFPALINLHFIRVFQNDIIHFFALNKSYSFNKVNNFDKNVTKFRIDNVLFILKSTTDKQNRDIKLI